MRESDALDLSCPKSLYNGSNRDADGNPLSSCKCIGSKCAIWRSFEYKSVNAYSKKHDLPKEKVGEISRWMDETDVEMDHIGNLLYNPNKFYVEITRFKGFGQCGLITKGDN